MSGPLRGFGTDSLFVCYAGPRREQALSAQRLSRWVVETI